MMMMDAGSLLVCLCVFVGSGALLLAISLFGVKERSYDELLAERRALAQGLAPKRAQEKRSKKQDKGRKPKEKEHPHVEFQDTPVIADEPPTIKRQGKRNKVQSILLNKDEGGAMNDIFEETPVIQPNHFEKIHPKDELELRAPQKHEIIEQEVKIKETKPEPKTSQKFEPELKKPEPKPSKQPETKNTQKQESSKTSKKQQELKKQEANNKKQDIPKQEPRKDITNKTESKKQETPKLEPKKDTGNKPDSKKDTGSKPESKKDSGTKPEPKKQETINKQETKKQKSDSKQPKQEAVETKVEVKVVQKVENELKKDKGKQDVDNKKSNKDEVDNTKKTEKHIQEVEMCVKEVAASQTSAKDKKKKKSELNALQQLQSGVDVRHDAAVSLLISTVRKAELSRGEIQLLIDLLLNKQHEAPTQLVADWSQGRADPVVKLKKQLAEKERALTTEQETTTGLQAKLRELRAEFNAERSAHMHTQRALEAAKQDTQLRQHKFAQQLIQREDMVRQQRSEEARRYEMARAEVERYAKAHNQQALQLRQREDDVAQLEAERIRIDTEKTQLAEQHDQLQSQLHQRESTIAQLEKELAKLEAERTHFESKTAHVAELYEQEAHKLRSRESELAMLKQEVARLEKELAQSHSGDKDKMQLEAMLVEQKQLMQEILLEKQESIKQLEKEIIKLKSDKEEEKRVHQLNLQNEIASVRAQLNSETEKQLQHVQQQLDEQRSKNDELRKKNWKVMEALNSAETVLRSKISNPNEAFLDQLRLEEQENRRQLIQRLLPEVKSGDETDALKLIAELRTTNVTTISSESSESEKLRTQLTHYRAVVSETEAMLASLETHVKNEEKNWRNELATRDAEISNLRELKTHVEELERQLDSEKRLRSQLEDEVSRYKTEFRNSSSITEKQTNGQLVKACHLTSNGTTEVVNVQAAAE